MDVRILELRRNIRDRSARRRDDPPDRQRRSNHELDRPSGPSVEVHVRRRDNLVSATVPTEGQTQFHYDTNGNLDWMKDPLLNQTSFQYDPMNQLAGITDSAPTPKTASYTYYPSGFCRPILTAAGL